VIGLSRSSAGGDPLWDPVATLHPHEARRSRSIRRSHGTTWFQPAPVWSPDSNSLAFTTSEGALAGQSTLKVIERDGSSVRDLTHLGAPMGGHRSPAWSNSGRFIAFATTRGRDEDSLWIVEAAGGTPRRLQGTALGLGNLQFGGDDRFLFFSVYGGNLYRLAVDPIHGMATGQTAEVVLSMPGQFDGLWMARDGVLAYGLSTDDTNIWTIDLGPNGEASEPARLTDSAIRTGLPDYSPDGRRLTYQQTGNSNGGPWVMNADGSGRFPLVTDGGGAGNPSWAPDGTQVLLQRDGDRSLWWVDLVSRRLTQLDLDIARSARNPRMSPDGREIAFWKIEANGSTNVWTQSVAGGSPHRVTADAESVSYPVWSPDSRWLAIEIKRGEVTHIGVVSKDGGPVEQLTYATGQSFLRSWSPDGDQIAFAGFRDGIWNIWTVSRRTRISRQLTHFVAPSDAVIYPSWSPDGRRIAFERAIRRGSVWTVQVQ
jgi:Tol biopolymer transport system component